MMKNCKIAQVTYWIVTHSTHTRAHTHAHALMLVLDQCALFFRDVFHVKQPRVKGLFKDVDALLSK